MARVTELFGVYPFSALELEEAGQVFQFGHKPNRVDLMNNPHPELSFAEAYGRRVKVGDGSGLEIDMIALEDLKTLKIHANRLKDLNDLEFIARLERRLKKP